MLGRNVVYVTDRESHRPVFHRPGYEHPTRQMTRCGLTLGEPVCMQRETAEYEGAEPCVSCFTGS